MIILDGSGDSISNDKFCCSEMTTKKSDSATNVIFKPGGRAWQKVVWAEFGSR